MQRLMNWRFYLGKKKKKKKKVAILFNHNCNARYLCGSSVDHVKSEERSTTDWTKYWIVQCFTEDCKRMGQRLKVLKFHKRKIFIWRFRTPLFNLYSPSLPVPNSLSTVLQVLHGRLQEDETKGLRYWNFTKEKLHLKI